MITLCPANTNISRDNYIEWEDKQHRIENRKNTVCPTSECAHRLKKTQAVKEEVTKKNLSLFTHPQVEHKITFLATIFKILKVNRDCSCEDVS